MNQADQPPSARRITLTGRVQGVGFRPFVYRVAHRWGVTGWVGNAAGRVEILFQGAPWQLQGAMQALLEQPPPLARPHVAQVSEEVAVAGLTGFTIVASVDGGAELAAIPPDQFACADCLAELADPRQRRYRYPFVNCTQCGPRYTIIDRLPYDRPHTAMAGFPLCPDCRREYADPLDRRFHAQPLACPACGPTLQFRQPGAGTVSGPEALPACVAALTAGRIVAVKGIGGYHLLCDARDEAAVGRLRARKPRPAKPLAVMLPWAGADGLAWVERVVRPTPLHAALLTEPMRPIVLTPTRAGAPLAAAIAPGLAEVGVMLPYSPLHHLLLEAFDGPLTATSANLSGEPVLTEGAEVEARLGRVAEAFLHHDRPIRRPADDPLVRVMAGAAAPLRLGRGGAPLELTLPITLPEALLGVGGQTKNSVALAWGERVVVSPHIGELDAPRSQQVFAQVIGDLQALYGVRAARLVHDHHPGYSASRWARREGRPTLAVWHHHAHASALVGEHGLVGRSVLVFTWDGVGLGEDGALWGGEALLGRPGAWRRVAGLRPFRLPGGEAAARQPWRSLAGLCWEAGLPAPLVAADPLLRAAWERGLNAPLSHAVGRLLDAAWVLAGGEGEVSFEGQGPMALEALALAQQEGVEADPAGLPLREGPWLQADWEPWLRRTLAGGGSGAALALEVHANLVGVVLAVARRMRDRHGIEQVGVSGGVWQNRLLTEGVRAALEREGFGLLLHRQVPCNDGGLAFGQLVEAAGLLGWWR